MKEWTVKNKISRKNSNLKEDEIIKVLLKVRGIKSKKDELEFLEPGHPRDLTSQNVGIDSDSLNLAVKRIHKAIKNKESIVIHADYDADGITAGAILWETLHSLGAQVMPYVPRREEEGRGMPATSIDAIRQLYDPAIIITVDHGVSAHKGIMYAKSLGIETIVTDHHEKPRTLPDCLIVHTTLLSGSGVSWFLSNRIASEFQDKIKIQKNTDDLLALTAIGTIADLVPLVGPNRSIAKFGIKELRSTQRVGLNALLSDAALDKTLVDTYSVSHILAPRINAMGRLEHALDALRLLCTSKEDKAMFLARQLGLTNKRRQDMTIEAVEDAKTKVLLDNASESKEKIIIISSTSYNQGIVGLVAGKLVEEYYRPAIVIAQGDKVSKASARSIKGFNIINAVRSLNHLLVDVGGHPLAAGFTILNKNIPEFTKQIKILADKELIGQKLQKTLSIDMDIPLQLVSESLWQKIKKFEPFGFGNPEPVFCTRAVKVLDARTVGKEQTHLKLIIGDGKYMFDAIAFGLGFIYSNLSPENPVDIVYTLDINQWNGSRKLQLKIKDIKIN